MKYRSLKIVLVLGILIASLIYGIVQNNSDKSDRIVQKEGYTDLTNWDFQNDGNAKLNTQMEIYFNQFIKPGEFDKGQKPYFLTPPANRGTFEKIKPFEERYFYATLRTKVRIKDNSEIMGIKSSLILSAYKIYVDGVEIGEIGKVGVSKAESAPKYMNLVGFFQPKSQEVEIVIHASDFYLGDCLVAPIEIGTAKGIADADNYANGKELFVFGILIIICIYHLGLYYKRRKDKSPLFFAFFCFLVSMRTLFLGERIILKLFDMPSEVYWRLGYLTAYLAPIGIAGFLYYTLEGLYPKKFYTITKYTSLFFAVATLILEYRYYDFLSIPFSIFIIGLLLYSIIKLVIGYIKKIEFADHVLFGFMLIGVAIANDIIYQFVLINKGSMVPFGVAAFTISQAFTLATKFSKAFTTAEQLTAVNEEILSDLKNANMTLEMRVEERTKDLTDALSELEQITNTDYLTKLPNRRYMYEMMNERIKNNSPFYVALGDIDNFKTINDYYGHQTGDEFLVMIAQLLKSHIDGKGVVCRWGGEEFLIVVDETKKEKVVSIIDNIRKTIEETQIETKEGKVGTTMTFGISRYTEDMMIEHCISIADIAMYTGKEIGRNKVVS